MSVFIIVSSDRLDSFITHPVWHAAREGVDSQACTTPPPSSSACLVMRRKRGVKFRSSQPCVCVCVCSFRKFNFSKYGGHAFSEESGIRRALNHVLAHRSISLACSDPADFRVYCSSSDSGEDRGSDEQRPMVPVMIEVRGSICASWCTVGPYAVPPGTHEWSWVPHRVCERE